MVDTKGIWAYYLLASGSVNAYSYVNSLGIKYVHVITQSHFDFGNGIVGVRPVITIPSKNIL